MNVNDKNEFVQGEFTIEMAQDNDAVCKKVTEEFITNFNAYDRCAALYLAQYPSAEQREDGAISVRGLLVGDQTTAYDMIIGLMKRDRRFGELILVAAADFQKETGMGILHIEKGKDEVQNAILDAIGNGSLKLHDGTNPSVSFNQKPKE